MELLRKKYSPPPINSIPGGKRQETIEERLTAKGTDQGETAEEGATWERTGLSEVLGPRQGKRREVPGAAADLTAKRRHGGSPVAMAYHEGPDHRNRA